MISLLGLAALLFTCWWLLSFTKSFSKPPTPITPLMHIKGHLVIPENSPLRHLIVVEPVLLQLIATPFTLPAIVEADPANLVKILPPLSGRIISINKRLGESVNVGDILLTLDSPDLAQARADLERAISALKLAEGNLARQKKLNAANIGARRDLQQANHDYSQAISELQRAQTRLKGLRVENSDSNNSILIVRSPIAGNVVELNGAVGGYWNDLNASIMTVANLSTVFVTASAQEKDLQHLFVGQNVDIVLDAYPQHLRSKVNYISALLNPETRTVSVRMLLDNKEDLYKPNMFARAIFLSQPHQGIVLPLTTIIQNGFDSIVFVETAPWQFEPRILKLGAQIGNKVEVLSGLKANERVVVKGGIILND